MVERALPRAFRLRKESKRVQERRLHPERVQLAHAVRHFQFRPYSGSDAFDGEVAMSRTHAWVTVCESAESSQRN